MFDTYAQVLPMGQTMSDTPEAPRQSLGKRVRFGDEPEIEESEESAAASTLATLGQEAAAGSAGAGGSGSACRNFADGPAASLSAAPGSELADGGSALDRAAAQLRDDFSQLEWIVLDDSGSESMANGGILMDKLPAGFAEFAMPSRLDGSRVLVRRDVGSSNVEHLRFSGVTDSWLTTHMEAHTGKAPQVNWGF